MTEKTTVKIEERKLAGKKVAKLREAGIVPAVVYGKAQASTDIQLLQQDAQRAINKAGKHSPVELDLSGKKQEAIIKDYSFSPASNKLSHISFQAISANEVVTTIIPVVVNGIESSPAVKAGLEVQQAIEQVEVRAKASKLPEKIEFSAESLAKVGDKIVLSDANLSSEVELTNLDNDAAIATVRAIEVEAEPTESTESAAPAAAEAADASSTEASK